MTQQTNFNRPTIGVILPMLSGFYMGEINATLRHLAQQHDVNLIFIRCGDRREFDLPVSLDHIDALIVVLHVASDSLIDQLLSRGIPVFSLSGSYVPLEVEHFFSDQSSAVEGLYDWLVESGHSSIGFCGALSVNDVRERYNAFQKAKQRYQHELRANDLFSISNCSLSGGREAAVQYYQRESQCTAVICATDHNAIGMIEQFKHLGTDVPNHVAVVGIDNIFFGSHASPALTTADQQLEALATRAFHRALLRIQGAPYSDQVHYVDQKIIVRESCGGATDHQPDEEHSLIREMIFKANNRSSSEVFENFYSQAENGFNAILDAQSLYGSELDWACLAHCDTHQYKIESWVEKGMTQPTPLPSESQVSDTIEGFPFLQGCPHYAATVMPVSTGNNNQWKLIAVIDSLSSSHSIDSQSMFNNYLDMLALFIERDSLLATSTQNERKSQQLLQQLEVVSNSSNDGIWEWDVTANNFRLNNRMLTILGLQNLRKHPQLSFNEFIQKIHSYDIVIFENAVQDHLTESVPIKADFRFIKSNGHLIWVRASGSGVYDAQGRIVRIIGSITDISEQRANEEKIHKMAYYDALTGVANRRKITEMIDQHISAQTGSVRAIMLMDLNRFKMINDSFGHHIGDALLKHVTQQLSPLFAHQHHIARLGGDEFVFFCQANSQEEAYQLANEVVRRISVPMKCDNIEISAQGSIGIAMYPQDAQTSDDLIKRADIAMYQAKKQGAANPVCYCSAEESDIYNKLTMEHHLKKALTNHEITLHYQPLYSNQDDVFTAVESLARWHSSELGHVPPDQFIPLAEEANVIDQLGKYLLHRVCCDIKRSKRLQSMQHVSVNISAKQLIQDDFANEVFDIVSQHQLSIKQFCFEVTETAAITDFSRCLATLNQLSAAGASISLDDFGTGYSSLSLLQKLPINEIKIDRSFIKDVDKDVSLLDFVSTITSMGRNLGFRVVLEGVETERHVQRLNRVGADLLQGYYFSMPCSVEQLDRLCHAKFLQLEEMN